jgi:hypothetical protein
LSITAYIAALTGLAYYFYLGLGSTIGSLTYAINLGRSIPTKYSNYCVRSTYRFTLSLLPTCIVFCARVLILAYALAICLPTCAYAASLLTGTTSSLLLG